MFDGDRKSFYAKKMSFYAKKIWDLFFLDKMCTWYFSCALRGDNHDINWIYYIKFVIWKEIKYEK